MARAAAVEATRAWAPRTPDKVEAGLGAAMPAGAASAMVAHFPSDQRSVNSL